MDVILSVLKFIKCSNIIQGHICCLCIKPVLIMPLHVFVCFFCLFVVVVFLYIDYLYYYSVWMFCTSNEALVRINLILIINVIIRLYIRLPV